MQCHVVGISRGQVDKKRSDNDNVAHHDNFLKINKCKDAIAGLREFVFSLCCDVYECIEGTKNDRKVQYFGELFSIWHRCHLEEVQAAAARKLRIACEEADRVAEAAQRVLSPVDLTDDIVPGASDSDSE